MTRWSLARLPGGPHALLCLLFCQATLLQIAAANYFTDYDWQSFSALAAARAPVDSRNFNRALLDAAVFHETNRRRIRQGLPALRYHPQVRKAAAIQAVAIGMTVFYCAQVFFTPLE